MAETLSPRAYAVFISYSHADNKDAGRQWATWLHHSLETYEIPPALIGRRNARGEPVPASLFPVFRDEEELSADADLSASIRSALEQSRTMVVLCSPRAAASTYVNDEIRDFKKLGKSNRIFALLIDGEPKECLPESESTPIAADARPEGKPVQGWTTAAAYRDALEEEGKQSRRQVDHLTSEYEKRLELAKLKVIAGVLGLPLDELTRRNQAFELAKARRRTRVLTAWLTAIGIVAIIAAVAGILALRNQKEAERQTRVAEDQRRQATLERDRALRENYVNIVREAEERIAAGEIAAAREVLFKASPALRQWEWWYLMARCGPAPMTLDQLAEFDPATVRTLKTELDDAPFLEGSNEKAQSPADNQSTLEYDSYRGRGGTNWQVRRTAGKENVLLHGFRTGMYGKLDKIILRKDHVHWRYAESDTTSVMASGEQLIEPAAEQLAFFRERYVTGKVRPGPPDETERDSSALDLSTWNDDVDEASVLITSTERADAVLVIPHADVEGDRGRTYRLDLATSAMASFPTPSDRWNYLDGWDPPRESILALTDEERLRLPEDDLGYYAVTVGRGPKGPLILSTWRFGDVRLRDGITGRILGESIGSSPVYDGFYGGDAAIVPGTELVAGWFWWRGENIAGVIDLRKQKVLVQFENAPDLSDGYTRETYGRVRVSPDGKEVVLDMVGVLDAYFGAWNLATGKLVYGLAGKSTEYEPEDVDAENVDAAEEEEEEVPSPPAKSGPKILVPDHYEWHPDGRFVALYQPNGATELRRNFATAPFAILQGIDPSGAFRVHDLGGKNRVLIGNAVVDTATWEVIITLPPANFVSADGNTVVMETRPGVIEVVRLPSQRPRTLRDSVLLRQIRDHDAKPRLPRPSSLVPTSGNRPGTDRRP